MEGDNNDQGSGNRESQIETQEPDVASMLAADLAGKSKGDAQKILIISRIKSVIRRFPPLVPLFARYQMFRQGKCPCWNTTSLSSLTFRSGSAKQGDRRH
jgi:hypothetical protein